MTTGKGPKKKLGEVLREVQAQIDAAMAPSRAIARQLLEDLGLEPEGTTQKPRPQVPRRRGAPTQPDYDSAYQELQRGEPFDLVFHRYCQKTKYKEEDKTDRANFRRAMKAREKRH